MDTLNFKGKLQDKLSKNGYSLAYKDTLNSTMDFAMQLQDEKLPAVVVADHQTRGRGRYSHAWRDKKGDSILATLVENDHFSKKIDPNLTAHLFTLSCCLSLCRLAKNEAVQIKWPNDLVIADQKIGGVLIDHTRKNDTVLIGLGINVYSSQIKSSTYLQKHCRDELDRAELLREIICDWQKNKKHSQENWPRYEKLWQKKSYLFGKNIRLMHTNKHGKAGIVTKTLLGEGLVLKTTDGISKIKLGDYRPGSLIILNK